MRNKLEFLTNNKAHRWEKWGSSVKTHYLWDKYSIRRTPTWTWKKYNADSTQKFKWDAYDVHSDEQHNWKQYEEIDTLERTDYYWNKSTVAETLQYPSWEKEDIDGDSIYVWNKSNAVIDEDKSAKRLTYYNATTYENHTATEDTPIAFQKVYIGYAIDPQYFEAGEVNPRSYMPCCTGISPLNSTKPDKYGNLSGAWVDSYSIAYNPFNDRQERISCDYMYICSNTFPVGSESWCDNSALSVLETVKLQLQPGTFGYFQERADLEDKIKKHLADRDEVYCVFFTYDSNGRKICLSSCIRYFRDSDVKIYEQENVNSPGTKDEQDTGTSHLYFGGNGAERLGATPRRNASPEILPERTFIYSTGYLDFYHPAGYAPVLFSLEDGSPSTGFSITKSCSAIEQGSVQSHDNTSEINIWPPSLQNPNAVAPDEPLNIVGDYIWGVNYNTGARINATYQVCSGGMVMGEKGCLTATLPAGSRLPLPFSYGYGYARGKEPTAEGRELRTAWIDGLPEDMAPVLSEYLYYSETTGVYYLPAFEKIPNPVYKRGPIDYGEVQDKDRTVYPDNGLQDNYWYTYLRSQKAQPYIQTSLYATGGVPFDPTTGLPYDDTEYLSCTDRPAFNKQTGLYEYTLGAGATFFVRKTNGQYIEVLQPGVYLIWETRPNNGSLEWSYGDYIGAQFLDSQYYQQTDKVIHIVYSEGDYIEQIITNEPDSYPQDGQEGIYWYHFQKSVPIITVSRGEYLGDVSYLNELHYPLDGTQDGYWYVYVNHYTIYSPGAYLGQIYSLDSEAYPIDGIKSNTWYKYYGPEFVYEKGAYKETINSTIGMGEYPQNGRQGSYWYVFDNYQVITEKDNKIGKVDSTDNQQYPEDGAVGNSWYVLTEDYQSVDPTHYIEDVWNDAQSTYPENGAQGEYYYKYQGYRYIPQYIINDTILKGGVKYQQEVNTSDDYSPGDVASAQIDFTIFTEPKDSQKYLDLECDYYTKQQETDAWELVGHFVITAASDMTATTTKITGFDNVIKLDKDVSDFMFNGGVVYPISISNLFTSLCNYCGVNGILDSTAVNLDFMVKDNFTTKNITARQVLALIAEVAAGFVKADKDGNIVLRGYLSNPLSLDKTKYVKATQGIYQTQKIDKLNVAMSTDDIGVSYGDGEVVYRIIDNPLLYIEDQHEIDTQIRNIYNVISKVAYVPGNCELLEPLGVQTGDVLDLDGEIFYVQSISWDGSKVQIVSKGKRERDVEKNQIDGSLDKLRGKSNELTRTIDETNSRITDVQAGLQSEISQTAGSINTRITNEVTGLESKINQTAGSISSEVDDKINQTKTEIKQTTDSISSTVSSQGQTITQIKQDLNGISLTYNSTNGTASITIGDVTVTDLVDGNYVQRQVAGIDMTGYVTFHSLETAGQTTINGSNITTGTISADRINMTGAISWGDLTQGCKDTIASYAGQDGQNGSDASVPDYIHSTYIDATRIVSPTIQGGTISAGTTASGYIQMSSTGMNFHSSQKAIIGMGYYSGNYQYPYIMLGAGVDSTGTDQGMIKKYADGIWIGDSDGKNSSTVGSGDGIFIKFTDHTIWAYKNGSATKLA